MGAPIGNSRSEKLDEKIILLRIKNNLARKYNRLIKNIWFGVSICSLALLIPLGIILSILIYIDNPGQVVFSHIRIGKSGKPFPCYKFRTMVLEAEKNIRKAFSWKWRSKREWERDFKLKMIRELLQLVGFLRKTSLDEFLK